MLGIIGGSGFYEFPELERQEEKCVRTPYGDVAVTLGCIKTQKVCFVSRHGKQHKILPHQINYRANVAALASLEVKNIIAVNAVGSISAASPPGSFVIPHQVIDYTYGREQTFDELEPFLQHIDFTDPFCSSIRKSLIPVLNSCNENYVDGGVYACTQGPRLESRAEIERLERDGADIVGMTLMPEAALARQKSLPYLSICLAVNWAAGKGSAVISMQDLVAELDRFNVRIRDVLHSFCMRK